MFSVASLPSALAAPVAGTSTATVVANSSANPITLSLSGGAASSVAVASQASHGTATASGTSISYTPTAGFAGADSFTYTATNASGTSAPATVTVTVGAASTTTAVTASPNASVTGQSVAISATVTATAPASGTPTGTVTFTGPGGLNQTVTLNGAGVAVLSTSSLVTGTIIATYNGAASYSGSAGTAAVTVGAAATATTVTALPNASVTGQSIAISATVTANAPASGIPTGTVTFTGPGGLNQTVALDASGVAGLTTTALATGTITATYNGAASYSGSAGTAAVTVGAATTTTAVTASPSSIVAGQSVAISATVSANAPASGIPTGTVTFTGPGGLNQTVALNGSGVAALSTTALVSGTITATYNGAASYSGSAGTAAVTVGAAATTTAVTASPSSSVAGQSVAISATVTANAPASGIPTGTVTFTGPGGLNQTVALDASGVAGLTTTALATGTITATYNGAASYSGSAGTATLSVGAASTTTAVTASPSSSVAGQLVAISATVTANAPASGIPTGTVTFTGPGGLNQTIALDASGVAALTTTALASGTITATYNGAASYGGSAGTAAVTVGAATTATAVTASPSSSVAGQSVVLSATVTANAPASGIPTGTVTFTGPGGLNQTAVLDASGVAGLSTTTLASGTITATYNGVASFSGSAGTAAVTVLSNNADLSNLTSGAAALDPAFSRGTSSYIVAAANEVDSLTLTPTSADADAIVTVNGQAVVSGSASQSIALPVGTTAISVVVTAADKVTIRTYTIAVSRAASANAKLAGFSSSVGTITPALDPAVFDYTVAVENDVETISLAPTAADPNAIVSVNGQVVASGSASPSLPLVVGANTISIVVTAQDGATSRTYTVTVTRRASTNAELSSLASSVGTLDPAFSADSFSYAVKVGNQVETISLTATAAEPNAIITINGISVAGGSVSSGIALAEGSTSIPVVVTAQDGTTRLIYTVTVERSRLAVIVASRTIQLYAGETATIDLTEGASGGPFIAAAIVDVTDESAGASRIESSGGKHRLVFESSQSFAGTSAVRFTLSNASGSSEPGTITFSILARPDPSQDPDVIGLLTAQADAAKRFARHQTRNFNNRLEQLHDEGERRRNSMNVRLGYIERRDPDQDRFDELRGHRTVDARGRRQAGPRSTSLAAEGGDPRRPGDGIATNDGFGRAGASAAPAESSDDISAQPVPSSGAEERRSAVWAGGFVNFGERDDGALDLDHTNIGVSGGIDHRFSDEFVGGFGLGYGRDKSDIGGNGTESRANAYSGAIYGSYKPVDHLFIDGLVGGSWLDFGSIRYVPVNGGFATGSRSGHQLFGSLTTAYEFRDATRLVSPYGRVEFSRSWLDGFTEDGAGIFALRYGRQRVDTLSSVIGLRGEYSFPMAWGVLTPSLRTEYTHDFEGSSLVSLGYADLVGHPYSLRIRPSGRDSVTLGLSLSAAIANDWSLRFDYRTMFGNDAQSHSFGLEIAKRF